MVFQKCEWFKAESNICTIRKTHTHSKWYYILSVKSEAFHNAYFLRPKYLLFRHGECSKHCHWGWKYVITTTQFGQNPSMCLTLKNVNQTLWIIGQYFDSRHTKQAHYEMKQNLRMMKGRWCFPPWWPFLLHVIHPIWAPMTHLLNSANFSTRDMGGRHMIPSALSPF